MEMREKIIEDFLEELASSAPVPGGGGAAGLVAAVGMSLGNMVLSLTTGKKKYAAYQEEIEKLQKKATELTRKLAEGMDEDAKAFAPLAEAYGLPKETEEEIAHRDAVMAEALDAAARTPLSMMEHILEAMKLIERISEIGSHLAISDAGVGIQCGMAALNGASLNVFINTKLMKDRTTADELNQQTNALLAEGKEVCDRTYQNVLDAIG